MRLEGGCLTSLPTHAPPNRIGKKEHKLAHLAKAQAQKMDYPQLAHHHHHHPHAMHPAAHMYPHALPTHYHPHELMHERKA